ncbi:MAG: UDP-N-acetylmuramoyl-L-alanyl-D-glutamate--2,6-diaminopimelate ligase, partial [Clostridia bacterium]|nr:UDP-N-acetylmuramoyl-L-alanyl-D-glutamate--2,6-diaminopimelate ligase [Clostridia bacterium]
KLFDMCDRAVINIDDKWAERLIKASKCPKIYTVSTNKNADFSAGNVREYGIYGSEYSVYQDGCEAIFRIGLIGDFFVSNSLMATAVALLFKIPLGSIRGTFASFPGIDGRMERVLLDGGAAVFIDYAHTPDALERALKALQSARRERGRIILVFGCGGDRDRQKRKEMAHIASRLADVIIITSDNSRSEAPEQIFSDILSGIDKEREYSLIEDRRAAIEYAIEISTTEDVILLAGKGHERYEIDKNGRHAFDERQIVKNAYEKHKR